jgi:hypothetical protein
MIRIGLNNKEKQHTIDVYLERGINKIFVFYPDEFPLSVYTDKRIEHVRYADIIMYKYFYRLLEEIDDNTLLVFNECLRTQNRGDLTYNCAHHYANQTKHVIVFEYFPFIENNDDFIILLDYQSPGKYKGRSFNYQFLADEEVVAKPQHYTFKTVDLKPTLFDLAKYEEKKRHLFDTLGGADPDTIPRKLHIFAGDFKRSSINPDKRYIARNDRFKLPNVSTYRSCEPGDYIILDFPHRRIDFNDFLKTSGMTDIQFINSGLKVDSYYINELTTWFKKLDDFYAKTSLYQ